MSWRQVYGYLRACCVLGSHRDLALCALCPALSRPLKCSRTEREAGAVIILVLQSRQLTHRGAEYCSLRHFLSLEEGELCPVSTRDLRFLCCDIDPVLVDRAEKDCPFPVTMTFVALDIMDPQAQEPLLSSFLDQFVRPAFDTVFYMYITICIHLTHRDSGLRAFLSGLSSLPRYLLVEAQLWKCYWAAARRLRKLGRHDFDHFCSLAIHGDMTDCIIQLLTNDHGMELVCLLWQQELAPKSLALQGKPAIRAYPTTMKHNEQSRWLSSEQQGGRDGEADEEKPEEY